MQNQYITSRIKQLCKEQGIKLSELIEQCNLAKSFIYDTEKRLVSPSCDKMGRVADYLDCSVDYLLGRTDNPNAHKNSTDMLYTHEKKTDIIDFIDAADAALLSSKHNLIIPFFENAVSAGVGEEFITDAEQFIRIPQTYKKLHADYAVRISGNSMEPDYKNDDILLVRYQQQLEPGELGIFIADNKMYFKKLGEGRLISLNPEYEDLIISSVFNPRIQGKVISKLEA